jgi:hypothetical protein
VHDPLNSVIWEFGGNVALSPVNSISVYAQGSTAFCGGAAKTLCAITPNTSINPLPLIQEQIGGFFDYYYSDHNPGEARVCWLGGYIYNGSSYVQQPGINCFYPNGSVAKGLPALSWGVTTGNGEAGNSGPLSYYGYTNTYDTKRDLVWAFADITHVSAWSPATGLWTTYGVTGGPSDCPQLSSSSTSCSMIYDPVNDQLLLFSGLSGNQDLLTVSVQAIVPVGAQPYGLGHYETSATAFRITRPIAYPALNTPYIDPLGARITRITNATPAGSGESSYPVPLYSQVKPTDSSETLFITVSGQVFDLNNNNHNLGLDLHASGEIRDGNYIWSRTIPKTLIGMDANQTTLIKKWTITTSGSGGSETGTLGTGVTLADLSGTYQSCGGNGTPATGMGESMSQVNQQDRDKNDHYMILACQKISPAYQIVMIVVDLTTGISGAEYLIHQQPLLTICTAGSPTVCTMQGSVTNASELAGLSVIVANASGGSWAGFNGTHTVASASGTSITFTFDSTGYGTYTGSTGKVQLPVVTVTGGCHPNFGPNFGYVGYLGITAIVDWGFPNAGNNRQCGVETFNLATAANPSGSWVLTGQVVADSVHYDLAAVGGVEYAVAFGDSTVWGALEGYIVACPLPNGFTAGTCVKKLHDPTGGGHISAHAYTAPVPFFIYDDDCTRPDDSWFVGCGEIVKVYWDSTDSVPHIERLAHSYTDTVYLVNDCCNITNSYWGQAQTTQNLDGTKLFFRSTWGPGDASNTYMMAGVGVAPSLANNGISVLGGKVLNGGKISR